MYKQCRIAKKGRFENPDKFTDAEPMKLVYVNPCDMNFVQKPVPVNEREKYDIKYKGNQFDKYDNIGRVVGGDWDMYKADFYEECKIYRLLYQRFKQNKKWEEIDLFQEFASGIDRGEKVWHRCNTREKLKQRALKIDKLYKDIVKKGYRTQYEMAKSIIKFFYKGKYNFHEITVNVDRNGNFLFVDGAHRLSISKLLNIKYIPVRILVRHKNWQYIRDEARLARANNQFPVDLQRYFDHQDLSDIF